MPEAKPKLNSLQIPAEATEPEISEEVGEGHGVHGEEPQGEERGRSSPRHPERCPAPGPSPGAPSRRRIVFY